MVCPENYTKWHPVTGIQVEMVAERLKKVSNCAFSVSIKEGTDIVDLAKRAITGAGGEFSGDQQGGAFTISTGIGKVQGNYTITGSSLISGSPSSMYGSA